MPPMIFSRRSGDFLHWPGARDGKFPPLLLEVLNDFFNHLAKVSEHLDRIISMNPRDQIRAPSDIDLVTFTPLHPLVVAVTCFHCRPPLF